jgi:hypothetical protein
MAERSNLPTGDCPAENPDEPPVWGLCILQEPARFSAFQVSVVRADELSYFAGFSVKGSVFDGFPALHQQRPNLKV